MTPYSSNADQLLYNRIGTVFDDRVSSSRAGGAVLLWTDGTLDYYGVALNTADGERLVESVAAMVRPAAGGTFTLPSLRPSFSLQFSGDPSEEWRSSQSPLVYGFASNSLGEIDITITPAKFGFVESFLRAGHVGRRRPSGLDPGVPGKLLNEIVHTVLVRQARRNGDPHQRRQSQRIGHDRLRGQPSSHR